MYLVCYVNSSNQRSDEAWTYECASKVDRFFKFGGSCFVVLVYDFMLSILTFEVGISTLFHLLGPFACIHFVYHAVIFIKASPRILVLLSVSDILVSEMCVTKKKSFLVFSLLI